MRRTVDPGLDAHLGSQAFIEDPYPAYRELRETAPVLFSESLEGWLVTGNAEVRAALHDYVHLSNFGWELSYLERLDPSVREELPELFEHFRTHGLIYSDPPLHTRLRRLVGAAFSPKAVKALRPHVVDVIDGLLAAGSDEDFDLIRDLAYPLPTIVIAELFGVPRSDRGLFKGWSSELTSFFGSADPDPDRARIADRSLRTFRAYLSELIEVRRAAPRDDLVSRLVQAGEGQEELTHNEILNTCVVFLVAGHETTTNLIGNAVLALLRRPEELEALRSDPDRIALVIEETLRYDGPIQRVRRMVARECELGGAMLRPGEAVHVMLGAANRDPDVFEDPDRFWPERPKNGHLAFGLGVHFCVGAGLARVEAPAALERLLARFGTFEARPGWEPERNHSLTIRGLKGLPLAMD